MNTITRRNVSVLFCYQAISGAQMPMLFVIGGLVGQSLSPYACLATLPISCIVFGSMLSASLIAKIMGKTGRKVGFWVANLMGALGATLAAFSIYIDSFILLIVGSLFSGTVMSSGVMGRFAAIDYAKGKAKAWALSIYMASGLFAAIIGPFLIKKSNIIISMKALGVYPFLSAYIIIIILNVFGIIICSFLFSKPISTPNFKKQKIRKLGDLLRIPQIYVAIITAMVSYALMNLVMTSTPLAVVGCGFTVEDASNIVSLHVLAMYGPSFFTGYLINYFGVRKIMGLGLSIIAFAGIVGLSGVEIWNFYAALILLGIGWNFGFIGATALLDSSYNNAEKSSVQGINDSLVFGCVTIASLASGGLMNCSGGDVVEGWRAVNYAMIPFLALAGFALFSLRFNPRS